MEHLLEHDGEIKLWNLHEIELRKVAEDVWVPVRAKRTGYDINDLNGQKVGGTLEISIDLEKSRFNEAIDEEVFEIKIPPGMKIYDKSLPLPPVPRIRGR